MGFDNLSIVKPLAFISPPPHVFSENAIFHVNLTERIIGFSATALHR